ncbi:hypothetical protein PFISCL1PPCAC_24559, partial [Pristionchus fissidentatus]
TSGNHPPVMAQFRTAGPQNGFLRKAEDLTDDIVRNTRHYLPPHRSILPHFDVHRRLNENVEPMGRPETSHAGTVNCEDLDSDWSCLYNSNDCLSYSNNDMANSPLFRFLFSTRIRPLPPECHPSDSVGYEAAAQKHRCGRRSSPSLRRNFRRAVFEVFPLW